MMITLTPNRRLSATLHKIFQQQQKEHAISCWETPDILPLNAWLQRLWQEYLARTHQPAPLLLNKMQEQFLWEKIILQTKDNERLLQISEAAQMAQSAWEILQQWQVSVTHPLFSCTEDYAAMQRWALLFEKQCRERHWIAEAALPGLLMKLIREGEILVRDEIQLVGFMEISPLMREFFSVIPSFSKLANAPGHEERVQATNNRISLETFDSEIQTLARWAKSIHENNPQASIGCVIPTLDKNRDRVKQLFSEVFGHQSDTVPFNISAGKSLSDYPVVRAALSLLQLHKNTVTREFLSYLLMTPFVDESQKESTKRANLDRELRKKNITQIKLTDHLPLISKSCPRFAKRLQKFYETIGKEKQTLSYAGWAEQFSKLLTTLGWPGERSLNSEEYQAVTAFLSLLNNLSTLDYVCQPADINQAVNALIKLCANSIFQPKTPEAPIQVLGILEAAGSPFDYLWVAGQDDMSLPPQPNPNPFIPKKLQRELQMPHATAERELQFCTQLIQQFQQNAEVIIFSHAKKNEELELQCSPLIKHLPEMMLDQLPLTPYLTPCERIYQTRQSEKFLDETAPAVTSDENTQGGIGIIKLQSLCPFRAFAEKRLHAYELESPLPGLRATDRGSILHTALELIWKQLNDQSALLSLSDHALRELIENCVNQALLSLHATVQERGNYVKLEKKRLRKLVWDWLQIEKDRPNFKVLHTEKTEEIKLNQLKLSIRVDRVDELADGKRLIIDYKTSKRNDIKDWLSTRPDDPQLPLYALQDQPLTAGITFAQIAAGENSFKGMSHYNVDIKGIKPINEVTAASTAEWQEQLNQWQTILFGLSDDFCSGKAAVNPKDPPQTCQWCKLKPLCRFQIEGGEDAQ